MKGPLLLTPVLAMVLLAFVPIGCDSEPVPVTGRLFHKCAGHEGRVYAVAISPDGKVVVSGSEDRTLRFWDPADGKLLRTVRLQGQEKTFGVVTSLCFSSDGKLLVVTFTGEHPLYFWDMEAAREVRKNIPVQGASGVAFSPDGRFLAVAARGVEVWNLKRERKLHDFQFPGRIGGAGRVTFSPDGTRLAAIVPSGSIKSDKKTFPAIRVWDVASGKEMFATWDTGYPPRVVAFSPDGGLLAVGGEGGEEGTGMIGLLSAKQGKLLRELWADQHYVSCVAFRPDGKFLASGGHEPEIKLWDVRTGKLAGKLEGHSDSIKALAFSPDGKTLVSVGGDKLVLIWLIGR